MKKLIAMIMILILVQGLTACSSGHTEVKEEAPAEAESAEAPDAKDNAEEAKRIFFLNPNRALDYFMYIESACVTKAEELGYEVTVVDFNNDFAKANDYISQAIVESYDLIMLSGDASMITGVEEANAANIPVINYNSHVGGGELAAFIASDNTGMGQLAGEYAIELLKEKNGDAKGNIVVVNYPQISDMKLRGDGFKEVVDQYPDVTIEEVIPKDLTIDESQKFVDNTLTAKGVGEIDIIFGANAQTALGSLAAVEAANRMEINVLGIDDEEGQINALKDAESPYFVTIAQNPIEIGTLCAETAEKIFQGEEVDDLAVPSRLVTKENVNDFVANEEGNRKALEEYKN